MTPSRCGRAGRTPRSRLRRGGDELLAVLRGRQRRGIVPLRHLRQGGTHPGSKRWTLSAGMPICPTSGPASATAIGCTGPGPRMPAFGAIRPSCCSIPYAKAIEGEVDWGQACFPYTFGDEHSRNDDDSAAYGAQIGGAQPVLRLGQRPPACHSPNETIIYEMHVKGFTARHPDVPRRCAAPMPALGHPAVDRLPHGPGRDRGRTAAGAPVRARRPPRRAGAAQLLGLQLHRLPRPAQRVRSAGSAVSRCRSSSPWSRRSTRPASRSYSTWSTTTRPKEIIWARAVDEGDRQRRLLPAGRGQPEVLLRHHRHRRTA